MLMMLNADNDCDYDDDDDDDDDYEDNTAVVSEYVQALK